MRRSLDTLPSRQRTLAKAATIGLGTVGLLTSCSTGRESTTGNATPTTRATAPATNTMPTEQRPYSTESGQSVVDKDLAKYGGLVTEYLTINQSPAIAYEQVTTPPQVQTGRNILNQIIVDGCVIKTGQLSDTLLFSGYREANPQAQPPTSAQIVNFTDVLRRDYTQLTTPGFYGVTLPGDSIAKTYDQELDNCPNYDVKANSAIPYEKWAITQLPGTEGTVDDSLVR